MYAEKSNVTFTNCRSCQYEVSCSFNDGICPGWENVKENDNLDWKRRQCVTVNFTGQPANRTARLQSPCICATGRNGSSLTFRYAIAGGRNSRNCPLTVFTTTMNGDVPFWTSSGATTTRFRVFSETITHDVSPFKITFQAKKTNGNPCGISFNGINLADVIYKGVAPLTTTFTTTTLTATKRMKTTTKTAFTTLISDGTGLTSDTTPGGGSLGDGAVGGIVVGVIVLVTLLLTAVAVIWRRRRAEQEANEEPQTTTNPRYMPDDNQIRGSLPGASSSAQTDTVIAETYERLAARPESNFYTALSTEGNLQPVSTPENYELLTVTRESSHYTSLTQP
ncbi:hypothetical protein BaRGS_00036631 [Batillaria attramentaria]|uniref:MAM domain-containing protein n=1 Tax=Batillaria attramentaria TaxID=370345 RepID=A0ABD0JBK5_9CAEN